MIVLLGFLKKIYHWTNFENVAKFGNDMDKSLVSSLTYSVNLT